MVADRPKVKVAASDIDRLISGIEVNFVSLTECVVSPGWGLSFPPNESAGMHYNLAGNGRLIAGTFPAISLTPHCILPPMTPFRIEAGGQRGSFWHCTDFPPKNGGSRSERRRGGMDIGSMCVRHIY